MVGPREVGETSSTSNKAYVNASLLLVGWYAVVSFCGPIVESRWGVHEPRRETEEESVNKHYCSQAIIIGARREPEVANSSGFARCVSIICDSTPGE